ncbi:AraC family transcriptional regulator [Paenibacillus paeoniae]|uniref:Helix-turn-helix domain-containing protein n=1 Tax=Paenibacillus paeoniae TaxID=2292705 RepID=A0A371PKW9_9BACL|nr:helix-turn-helix domain-containing protein [Paenibacillus paeoniae]REK76860.1 helix-turn-helix domain-containing protein [Paenibacillus paeoniae]
MEQIKIISSILGEIESQMYDKQLGPDSLAKQFYTNVSDLQKTFRILTGITIGEYIRFRRLSNAAMSLRMKHLSILEAALDACFETPEAFSKAFKRFHGISPREARQSTDTGETRYFGPMHIKFSVESSAPLAFKMAYLPSLYFVGKSISVSNETSQYEQVIQNFWEHQTLNGSLAYLEQHFQAIAFAGISLPGGQETFIYGVGILTTEPVAAGREWDVVPCMDGSWVQFEVGGETDEDFSRTRNRVLSEWLLVSDHSISLLPEIEYYPLGESESSEIWFPLTSRFKQKG